MFVDCPHCKGTVEVIDLNCRIFRHGILKATGQQIDPHACKPVCDDLFLKGLIYGCGKPFRVSDDGVAEVCEYI